MQETNAQRAENRFSSSVSSNFAIGVQLELSHKMTSLFPHPTYAEDQPSARVILYLHVMRASSMVFPFVSLFYLPVALIRARRSPMPYPSSALLADTLKISGRSLVIGAIAGIGMTWSRMRGKEEIEWKDRSWRILENKGELQTDWAALSGAGVGAAAAAMAARRGAIPMSTGNALLGGAGLGMATGVPFMIGTFVAGRHPR